MKKNSTNSSMPRRKLVLRQELIGTLTRCELERVVGGMYAGGGGSGNWPPCESDALQTSALRR